MLPIIEIIDTAPSDAPQANIKPNSLGAQHTEFTKKKSYIELQANIKRNY